MPNKTIQEFLDKEHVKYNTIKHSPAFTAQEIAERAHIAGEMLAKTVIVKLDGKLAMFVLPSNHQVDLQWLKDSVDCKEASLASEYEFSEFFPDCETGAMPPFGNLYNMTVYVEEDLSKDKEIAFNAGNHEELIRMRFSDFKRLVKPKILH